ncbi:hypothetical protein ACGC1H_005930 [Rhizoctonia solani]
MACRKHGSTRSQPPHSRQTHTVIGARHSDLVSQQSRLIARIDPLNCPVKEHRNSSVERSTLFSREITNVRPYRKPSLSPLSVLCPLFQECMQLFSAGTVCTCCPRGSAYIPGYTRNSDGLKGN